MITDHILWNNKKVLTALCKTGIINMMLRWLMLSIYIGVNEKL